nr:hypothetical protein Hi04_10k_c3883_00016 [uncultured bacterium]
MPLLVMVFATAASTTLMLWAVTKKHISIIRDGIFVLFWLQALIYMHVVPTINAMFPDSEFAFPHGIYRAIRYTDEQLSLYGWMELAAFALFFVPLIVVYRRRARLATEQPLVAVSSNQAMVWRLYVMAAVLSLAGVLYLRVALSAGLLSRYAASFDAFQSLSRPDFFIIRLYQVGIAFWLMLFVVSFASCRPRAAHVGGVLIVAAPGLFCYFINVVCAGRSEATFVICLPVACLGVRYGLGPVLRRRLPLIVICVVGAVSYMFYTIPYTRYVATKPHVGLNEVIATLDPTSDRTDDDHNRPKSDLGPRLDGVELIVLSTPQLLRDGPSLGAMWLPVLATPLLPLSPDLEREMKESKAADIKYNYLRAYTNVETEDYTSVSLTETYLNFGPLGFVLAAGLFGTALSLGANWLRCHGWRPVVALFLISQEFAFEEGFSSLLVAWIRALPFLLLALALNPFRLGRQGSAFRDAPEAGLRGLAREELT